MESTSHSNRRKIFFVLFKAIVSAGLLILIFKKVSPVEILAMIQTIPISSFITCLCLIILAVFTATLRWRLFIPSAPPTNKLFSLYLIGNFFNTVMPGMIGGDAVKAYYLNKKINDLPATLASIFFERFLGYVSLVLICMVSYPFIFNYIAESAIKTLFPTVIVAFVLITCVIFRTDFLGRFKLTARFNSFLTTYTSQRKQVTLGLIYSLLIQCLYVLSVFVLAKNLQSNVSIIFIFAFFPIITMLSSLPVSISGIGIREASYVILFGAIGWEPGTATALSLAWFLAILITGLFGLVEFLRVRR